MCNADAIKLRFQQVAVTTSASLSCSLKSQADIAEVLHHRQWVNVSNWGFAAFRFLRLQWGCVNIAMSVLSFDWWLMFSFSSRLCNIHTHDEPISSRVTWIIWMTFVQRSSHTRNYVVEGGIWWVICLSVTPLSIFIFHADVFKRSLQTWWNSQ